MSAESPDSWFDRLDALLLEALALPSELRSAFLDRRCAGEPALRKEAEELLDLETGVLERLDRPFFDLSSLAADIPGHIGPYRILEELGTGGTATVYLGLASDGSDPRPVAIKVLRGGGVGPESVRHLRREGMILGGLRHPWIAQVHGCGLTADRRPFLVMDHIEGQPLDRWAQSASLAQRLRLFLNLCDAVSHAHGKLVVHGDLKPGNILVTAAGEPRVLDFGIARLLDPDDRALGAPTQLGHSMLTPAYASPEQMRQRPLGVASDIYSLGVILFELLTGRLPHEPTGESFDWRSAVCEVEPRPPSVVARESPPVGSRRLAVPPRRLAGDLDAIVLKMLRKESELRYSSVARLVEDLRRHLEGRPVLARRGTFTYRAGKLIQRNRSAIALSLLVLVALAGFFVTRERQRARLAEERDKANQVQGFLLDLFLSVDPVGRNGGDVTARELLDQGVARLAQMDGQPAVQASFMGAIGEVYANFGDRERSLDLISRSLALERRSGTPLSVGVAQRRMGAVLRLREEHRRSEAVLRSAISRLEEVQDGRFELSLALDELGLTLMSLNRLPEARDAYLRSLRLLGEAGLAGHPEATSLRNNLALIDYAQGRYAEASRRFEEVLARLSASVGESHPNVATAANNLAGVKLALGDLAAAERLFREARRIQSRALGSDSDVALMAQVNLAAVVVRRGRYAEADALLRDALGRLRKSGRGTTQVMAAGLRHLADLRLKTGDHAQAAAVLREARSLCRQLLGADHPAVLEIERKLAALRE